MSCCPLCGGAMDAAGLWLLRDRGMVGRGDFMCQLTAREFAVFDRLFQLHPRVVSTQALMDWLYQLDAGGTDVEIKIIDVYICKIRRKLKPLGALIQTHWGQGYSLTLVSKSDVRVVEANA